MSILAILATTPLWLVPGEMLEPKVPIRTAAPAAAGRMPARIITGMKVAPTAAAQPDADGMATLMKLVMMVVAGIRRMPSLLRGAAKNLTKFLSHPVVVTT